MEREIAASSGHEPQRRGPVARRHRYAIVVGIDRYPGLPHHDLQGACADAEAFASWLVDPTGGDVPPENVRRHLGSRPADVRSARPIKRDIDRDLHEFVTVVRREAAPARLYLYFAGHGMAAGLGTAALLMANAENGHCSNLSLGPYRRWLERCRDFTEIVMFCDCCRTLSATSREGLPPHESCPNPIPYPQNVYVALASEFGQRSYEQGGHGRFTTALLEGLRGVAADHDGDVRADVLSAYLYDRFPDRPGASQRPETTIVGPPIVLAHARRADVDVVINVRAGDERIVAVLGPDGAPAVSERRRGGAWRVRLGIGLYELNDPSTAPVLFKVTGPGVVVEG